MESLIPVNPVSPVTGVWRGADDIHAKIMRGGLMQKYFKKLEDFKGASKHSLRDKVVCYVRMTLIFVVSLAAMLAVCGALEVM